MSENAKYAIDEIKRMKKKNYDIILMSGDNRRTANVIAKELGIRNVFSFKKTMQNLAMSFAYNAITISIATGLLYGFTHSLFLTPTLAALGWIVTDSAVFGYSLLVRKFNTVDNR